MFEQIESLVGTQLAKDGGSKRGRALQKVESCNAEDCSRTGLLAGSGPTAAQILGPGRTGPPDAMTDGPSLTLYLLSAFYTFILNIETGQHHVVVIKLNQQTIAILFILTQPIVEIALV